MNTIMRSFRFWFVFVLVGCGGGGTTTSPDNCTATQHWDGAKCIDNVDTTPPWATITSPKDGAAVFGNVALTATVTDSGSGVKSAEFRLDGTMLQSIPIGTTAPAPTWDTTKTTDGFHTLTVHACDNANNCGKVATSNVIVANQTVAALCPQKIKDDLGQDSFGNDRKVKNCPVIGGMESGHFVLYIKNGACWAKIFDEGPHGAVGSLLGDSLASLVTYSSPVISGGSVSIAGGLGTTLTCQFK